METPKPKPSSIQGMRPNGLVVDETVKASSTPKPKVPDHNRIRVRNPAFREHEGLRALQLQLHSNKGGNKNRRKGA